MGIEIEKLTQEDMEILKEDKAMGCRKDLTLFPLIINPQCIVVWFHCKYIYQSTSIKEAIKYINKLWIEA
jgi:hypothetical protein